MQSRKEYDMKKLFEKKTTWVGIAEVALGIGLLVAGDIPGGFQTIIFGFGIITGRHAYQKATGK